MPWRCILAAILALSEITGVAQQDKPSDPVRQADHSQKPRDEQINVNWLYGSYIPKEVPRKALNGRERVQLYIRQTYTTPGIYAKTMVFALYDQITDSKPEWGGGFGGFAKRFGDQHAQFVIQNSVSSLGNGLLGWEPRYDRCRCDRFWPRTRYAILRNFVTYDRTETALRPQIMPYLGAFGAAALATTWHPGNPSWQVRGYQAAITQVFIGTGVNLLGEFAPEIGRTLHLRKSSSSKSAAASRP
jgi:hypothetical protein